MKQITSNSFSTGFIFWHFEVDIDLWNPNNAVQFLSLLNSHYRRVNSNTCGVISILTGTVSALQTHHPPLQTYFIQQPRLIGVATSTQSYVWSFLTASTAQWVCLGFVMICAVKQGEEPCVYSSCVIPTVSFLTWWCDPRSWLCSLSCMRWKPLGGSGSISQHPLPCCGHHKSPGTDLSKSWSTEK